MIRELLQRAIEQKNEFMTIDMIKLQMQFFFTAGKITQADVDELTALLPVENVETVE